MDGKESSPELNNNKGPISEKEIEAMLKEAKEDPEAFQKKNSNPDIQADIDKALNEERASRNLPEASRNGGVDDPHDSWDADAFQATLKKDNPNNPGKEAQTELNKEGSEKESEWPTGAVFSIKSKQQLHGASETSVQNKYGTFKEFEEKSSIEADNEDGGLKSKKEQPKWRTPDVKGGTLKEEEEKESELSDSKIKQENLNPSAFEKAKAEWKEARDNSDRIQRKLYGENGSGGKYAEFLAKESKGWRGFANLPRRLLGLQPHLNQELEDMETSLRTARQEYFEKAEQLKNIKKSPDSSGYVKNQEVLERYQRLLAHKLVVGVHEKKIDIQERQVLENEKNSKLKPVLASLRKYRYVRWGATAAGYAVLAGATGGVAAAALAGGSYAARLGGAMAFGSYAGTFMRGLGVNSERLSQEELQQSKSEVKGDFFKRGFVESETEIDRMIKDLEKTRAISRGSSAAVAMAAGFAGGGMAGAFSDSLDVIPQSGNVTEPSTTEPHPSVEGNMTPPNGVGTPPTESQEVTEVKPELAIKPEPGQSAPATKVESTPETKAETVHPVPEETQEPKVAETESQNTEESAEETEQESVEVAPMIEHEVVKGDNGWKIMKDDSSVLRDMSLVEQNKWQVELWDSLTPEEAKSAGFVKSGGNVDLIYPGEKINVSMLDKKLTELMQQNSAGEIPTPTPRPETVDLPQTMEAPEVRPEAGEPVKIIEAPEESSVVNKLQYSLSEIADKVTSTEGGDISGPVTIHSESGTFVVEHPVSDVDQMTLNDMTVLMKGVEANDTNALKLLESMGEDKQSITMIHDWILNHRSGEANPADMTVGEYLNKYKDVTPTESIPSDISSPNKNIPEVTPFDGSIPQPGDIPVREASTVVEAANDNPAMQEFIRQTEKGSIWSGKSDISGSLNKLSSLTFENISQAAANDNLEATAGRLGVSTEAYTRWMERLQESVAKTPPLNQSETVGQYITRINTNQSAA